MTCVALFTLPVGEVLPGCDARADIRHRYHSIGLGAVREPAATERVERQQVDAGGKVVGTARYRPQISIARHQVYVIHDVTVPSASADGCGRRQQAGGKDARHLQQLDNRQTAGSFEAALITFLFTSCYGALAIVVVLLLLLLLLARDVIYTSRACATMSLSICL